MLREVRAETDAIWIVHKAPKPAYSRRILAIVRCARDKSMPVSDPPPIIAPQPADRQTDVVEIVGRRAGDVLKTDRRTYQVRQTPNSAQKDVYQLLRGIPAVTLSPDSQIQLLGAAGVTLQIDGRTTQPDLLRSLHGIDIERIEVITNPSAQYSAQGSGGIINIVLRKKASDGISGTVDIAGSTLGRAEANAAIKIKRGKWTYEIETTDKGGAQTRSRYDNVRRVEPFQDGPATGSRQQGRIAIYDNRGSVHGKVSYDASPATNIVAEAYTGILRHTERDDSNFTGLTPDFARFSENQHLRIKSYFYKAVAALDHKGKKDGETLKASAQLSVEPAGRRRTEATFDDGDAYRIGRSSDLLSAEAQIDWQHPLGQDRLLSLGAHWNRDESTRGYDFDSRGAVLSLGPDTISQFTGKRDIVAVYATLQQRIGGWTVLPGIRMESEAWRVASPGQADGSHASTEVFPTVHLERALAKSLQVSLSYSKRIDRPDLYLLQPYTVVQDVLTLEQGNPTLRDQATDSYELNLHFNRGALDAGMTLYDREMSRVWASSYVLNALGKSVTTQINAGRRSDCGAEFDVNVPLARRVKLSGSVNLFYSRVPVDQGDGIGRQQTFRYTTNSTLEWDGPQRGSRSGDIAQVQISTESPSRDLQLRQAARHSISGSYTHSLCSNVSLTLTAQNVLTPVRNRSVLTAPLVQEDDFKRDQPELVIKLLKTFGKS